MHAQHVQGLCASQGPSALFLAGVCLYLALPTVYYLLHKLCYLQPIQERAAEASPSKERGSGMTAKTGATQMHQPQHYNVIKTCDAALRPRPRLRDMIHCHSETFAHRQRCILWHEQINHSANLHMCCNRIQGPCMQAC